MLFTAALLAVGCSRSDRRPEEPDQSMMTIHDSIFHPPQFPQGRTLDTVMALDFDGRGRQEYVVTSRTGAPDSIPGARADLVQIFSYDSLAHAFRAVLVDSLIGVHDMFLRDLTGDGVPEVVVTTDGGGNDPIASRGLAVYSGSGGTIRTIFQRLDGDPELTTMRDADGPVIVTHDLYWPDFVPHVGARAYANDLLAFKGDRFVSVRADHPKFFLAEAQKYLDEYRHVRDSVTRDTADFDAADDDEKIVLGSPAALAMLSLRLAGAQASLRSFWDSEKDFLGRRLSEDYMDDLSAIYAGTSSGAPATGASPAFGSSSDPNANGMGN
jgi:hypothetical protein